MRSAAKRTGKVLSRSSRGVYEVISLRESERRYRISRSLKSSRRAATAPTPAPLAPTSPPPNNVIASGTIFVSSSLSWGIGADDIFKAIRDRGGSVIRFHIQSLNPPVGDKRAKVKTSDESWASDIWGLISQLVIRQAEFDLRMPYGMLTKGAYRYSIVSTDHMSEIIEGDSSVDDLTLMRGEYTGSARVDWSLS